MLVMMLSMPPRALRARPQPVHGSRARVRTAKRKIGNKWWVSMITLVLGVGEFHLQVDNCMEFWVMDFVLVSTFDDPAST